MTGLQQTTVIVTCEHAVNRVPSRFRQLFSSPDAREALDSHRGYDPGALALARTIARQTGARLTAGEVTRLLIELNRSPHHRQLFSEFSRRLDRSERQFLFERYYAPWREQVERQIAAVIDGKGQVLHLSIHTFTPIWQGVTRTVDIGLLYDPARGGERQFCRRWQQALRTELPGCRVLRNEPYRGNSDGFTTALRRLHPEPLYRGIELEVNQRWPREDEAAWREFQQAVSRSLLSTLGTGETTEEC